MIVLVTNHADAPVVPLLRSELEALGMRVVQEDRGENEVLPRDLSLAARRVGAMAGFRVLISRGTVEVWISDRVTGKVVLRELFAQGADKVDETVVVVRAVELLRGSLMELDAPHPPRGEVAASAALYAVAGYPAAKERFSLSVGSLLMVSPGGTSPAPGAVASLAWRLRPRLEARLVAGGAVSPARLVAAEGVAEVWPRWVELRAALVRPPSPSRFRPRLAGGVALLASSLTGSPTESYVGSSRTLVSPAATLSAGTALVLASNLRIAISAWGALAARSTRIVFAGREVGSYGRLFAAGTAELEVAWP